MRTYTFDLANGREGNATCTGNSTQRAHHSTIGFFAGHPHVLPP
jgi:hypothetical protein